MSLTTPFAFKFHGLMVPVNKLIDAPLYFVVPSI